MARKIRENLDSKSGQVSFPIQMKFSASNIVTSMEKIYTIKMVEGQNIPMVIPPNGTKRAVKKGDNVPVKKAKEAAYALYKKLHPPIQSSVPFNRITYPIK